MLDGPTKKTGHLFEGYEYQFDNEPDLVCLETYKKLETNRSEGNQTTETSQTTHPCGIDSIKKTPCMPSFTLAIDKDKS